MALIPLGLVVSALILLMAWPAYGVAAVTRNRTSNVDTRIGTGGFGFGIGELNPGPSMPFGCLRLGPDTSIGLEPIRIPFQTYAGYAYDANWIECFSHTHVVGAGLGDFQNFGITVVRQYNNDTIRDAGYKSLYAHNQEVALPGYYAVELLSHNTYAELTVSGTHAAMHRYTCRSQAPESPATPCILVMDVCHGFPAAIADDTHQCKQAQIYNISSVDGGATWAVDAYILMAGTFSRNSPLGGIQIYLHMEVSATAGGSSDVVPLVPSTWENGTINANGWFTELTTSGSLGIGLQAADPPAAGSNIQFLVRAGLSFVSPANAKTNLYTQQQHAPGGPWMTFEEATQVAVDAWEGVLGNVAYQGGAGDDAWHRTVFDSAMYRAHLPPSTYSEANGEYLGQDMHVHTVPPGQRHLSDLSIWDIFRTQTPMLLWTQPRLSVDLTSSMMESYDVTGQLPKWIFANIETNSMVGLHSAVIFAEYAAKDLGGINPSQILEVIDKGIAAQNHELQPYGYITTQQSNDGSSNTLDYAVDAAAVAYLANALGNTTVAQANAVFAQAYRNVFDNSTTFFCPRWANGTFSCPDPTLTYPFENTYTEGDSWQYNWYVPQDPRGLISLFPSPTTFVDKLYDFFSLANLWVLNNTLPNPYFWAGNEPDIQAPVLFNWAGNEFAYLTCEVFVNLLDLYYTPYPSGVPGDDDYGALSSMAFWGYVGIFPMVPGSEYALFAPRFDSIDFRLRADDLSVSPWRETTANVNSSGLTTIVSIRCSGRPSSGIAYVANVTLDGQALPTALVTHNQLLASSKTNGSPALLQFWLTGEPTVFGSPPPSLGGPPVYQPKGKKT